MEKLVFTAENNNNKKNLPALILMCQGTTANSRDGQQKWALTTASPRTETGIGRRIIPLGINK